MLLTIVLDKADSYLVRDTYFTPEHNHLMGSICLESLNNGLANTASSSNDCDDDHSVGLDLKIC